jgi:hypothetical protein
MCDPAYRGPIRCGREDITVPYEGKAAIRAMHRRGGGQSREND